VHTGIVTLAEFMKASLDAIGQIFEPWTELEFSSRTAVPNGTQQYYQLIKNTKIYQSIQLQVNSLRSSSNFKAI